MKHLKTIAIFFAAGILLTGAVSAQKSKPAKVKPKKPIVLKNQTDSLSYAIGESVMTNLTDQGLTDVNIEAVKRGMEDVRDKVPAIPAATANQYVNDYFMQQYVKKAEKDKGPQLQWLEDNKTKDGITTTASGLQYRVTTMGTGVKPTTNNKVKVHYKGSLIDGTIFDSSYDRNEPIEFPVTGVIKGWTEALLLMPQGSKWTLYIPYTLAYGEQGAGGTIPPYATLIFDVELLEVK